MTYINCNAQPLETLDKLTATVRRIKAEIYGLSVNPRIRKNATSMRIHLVGLRPGSKRNRLIAEIEVQCCKFRRMPPRRKNESDEHLNARGWQPTVIS